MPSMHYYSMGLLRMGYETATRAGKASADAHDGLTDETLIAIVLAATAAEAFMNDLTGAIRLLVEGGTQTSSGDGMRLAEIGNALESLEDNKASTRSKYLVASLLLNSKTIQSDREPFQSFDDLVALRNGIVHAKPVSPDDRGRPVRITKTLAQRGLCAVPAGDILIRGGFK